MKAGPAPATVYFENLNTVRLLAALLVILHHTEQFKSVFHIPNSLDNPFIFIIGKLGVVMFFVLSGFLISYLLFTEQQLTGTIGVRNFYIRRILRIWPLYFLTVTLAFLYPLSPALTLEGLGSAVIWHNLAYKILLFVLFLPNLVLAMLGVIPYASHTWSIGAEEQFYLVWPVLNKIFPNKRFVIPGVICSYLALKWLVASLPQNRFSDVAGAFLELSPIDCMAIGGFFALIVYQPDGFTRLRRILYARPLQWAALILTAALIARGAIFPYYFEFYSLLFGILICNFADNPRRIFSMENPVFSYLGKISYGLYMFHPIVIVLVIRFLQALGALNNYLLYPLVLLSVCGVAALSYELFEKTFIHRKLRYSQMITGDNARHLNIKNISNSPIHSSQ